MITFETKLNLRNFIRAEMLRIYKSLFIKILLALYLLYFIWGIVIQDMVTIYWSLGFIFILTVFIPLFKYLSMKYRFKISTQTNFFDTDEFGIIVGAFKRIAKKEVIKSIEFGKDYVYIKLYKGSYGIPGESKDLTRLKGELMETGYRKLINQN